MKVFYEHEARKNEGQQEQTKIANLLLGQCEELRHDLNVTHTNYQRDLDSISAGIYWIKMCLDNSPAESAAQLWLETKDRVVESSE